MKIAFFTQNYKQGGLDTFIVNLLRHWPPGDDILLFCNESHPGLPWIRSHLPHPVRIIPYRFLLAHEIPFRLRKMPAWLRWLARAVYWAFGFFYLFYQTWMLFRRHNPDRLMVINGSYPGGDACLAATVSWAFLRPDSRAWHNVHSLAWPYSRRVLSRWKEKLIDQAVARAAAGFIAVSHSCMLTLANRPGLAQVRAGYIYNGIADLQANKTSSLTDELSLPPSARFILMLGVFEPHKGHALAIKAMDRVVAACPEAYLLACGDADNAEFSQVQRLREASPARNHIILQPHRQDTANLFAQAELVIMPSQTYESFGYTAVEAMACGLPVVVTRVGGLPEVVEDHVTGYILAPDDDQGFAERMIQLLGDASLRSRMGALGQVRFRKKFMADRMAKEYARILDGGDFLNIKQKVEQ